MVQEIGGEMIEASDRRTEAFFARGVRTPDPLPPQPLDLAVVQVDGGRIQTRAAPSPRGVHDPAWRENKVGLFVRAKRRGTYSCDPQPELPKAFLKFLGEEGPPAGGGPAATAPARPKWAPEPLFQTCISAVKDAAAFGRDMAAEADARGFGRAEKGVFLADGQAYNWKIHKRRFKSYTAVLDFVHAVEHAHAAAKAAGGGRALGEQWARALWEGRVDAVVEEMDGLREKIPPPLSREEKSDHPGETLRREAGYFRNNRGRMDYPTYRRAGLPVVSSGVESKIRQLNHRTKGSQMFWSRTTDAMLTLRAAVLSDDDRLSKHLSSRPGLPWSRSLPKTSPAA